MKKIFMTLISVIIRAALIIAPLFMQAPERMTAEQVAIYWLIWSMVIVAFRVETESDKQP